MSIRTTKSLLMTTWLLPRNKKKRGQRAFCLPWELKNVVPLIITIHIKIHLSSLDQTIGSVYLMYSFLWIVRSTSFFHVIRNRFTNDVFLSTGNNFLTGSLFFYFDALVAHQLKVKRAFSWKLVVSKAQSVLRAHLWRTWRLKIKLTVL